MRRQRQPEDATEHVDLFPFLSIMLCVVGVLAFVQIIMVLVGPRKGRLEGAVADGHQVGYQVLCGPRGGVLVPPPLDRLGALLDRAQSGEAAEVQAIRQRRRQHETRLAPRFFLCRGDAIAYLDPQTLSARVLALAADATGDKIERVPLGYLGLDVEVAPQRGMTLWPRDISQWSETAALGRKDDPVRRALEDLDPARNYAFFFVSDEPLRGSGAGSGFGALAGAQALLKPKGVQFGWMPFDEDHPPYLCFFDDNARCRFEPASR